MLGHTAVVDPLAADFAAFADRRDAAALARVFDATAGRLLLVAAHLAGRTGHAEDLVQATFVQAMEKAAQWDRSRPPWPWLVGILQHEAAMAWRRQQRRREVGLDAAAAAAAPAARHDPFLQAATADVVDAVTRAIDALPLAVRQVLRLRLVHGLSPIEIARALELPPGTVRVRLHRGRDALQQALPAGLAGTVALVLAGDGVLLAQVRGAVLARAGAGLDAATTAATTTVTAVVAGAGSMTTTKFAFGMGAAAIAVLGTVVALARGDGAELPAPLRTVGAAAAAVAPRAAGVAPGDAGSAARERVAATAAARDELLVRVLDTAGKPVAGAVVALCASPATARELRRELASAAVDARGVARLPRDLLLGRSELHYRTTRYEVRASAPGHTAAAMEVGLAECGGPAAPLQLALRAVVTLRGRVVDDFGRPVAGAVLALGGLPGYDGWRLHADAGTAEDGTFEIPLQGHDLKARLVAARDDAHGEGRCELPPLAAVAPGTSCDVGTIVLRAARIVRGRVLLADGSPLADYPLHVDLRELPGAVPSHVRRTDASGGFAIAIGNGQELRSIAVDDRTGTECARAEIGPADREITLVVDRQLLVLDARDPSGESVPGARVLVQGFDLATDRDTFDACERPANSGWYPPRDAAGRHLVLSPFGWGWVAGACDEDVVPVTWRHETVRGTSRVEHTLTLSAEQRFGSLLASVRDPAGAAVTAFRATLQHRERDDRREVDAEAGRVGVEAIPVGLLRVVLDVPFGERTPLGDVTSSFAIDVEIRDGERSDVDFAIPRHGRVAFRLHDPLDPERTFMDPEILADGADETGPVAFVGLAAAPRETVRLLGQTFAPGVHTFAIEADGWCRVTRTVNVVAGEVAIVDVPLVPLAPR